MYPRVKEIAGRQYVYLVEGVRKGQSVRQNTVAYLGPLVRLTLGIPAQVRRRVERRVGRAIDWEALGRTIAKFPVNFDDLATRRTASIQSRNQFRSSFVRKRSSPSKAPKEILSERAPGELEALTRLAKQGFESMFEQVGPFEYRLRKREQE